REAGGSKGGGAGEGLAWVAQPLPADVQVSAAVMADSLTPAGVFLRGANLTTGAPDYYAVTVTRGLVVELTEAGGGTRRAIASAAPTAYLTGVWVRLTLAAQGTSLKVRVTRADTNQSLTPDGRWVAQQVWAIEAQV